MCVGRWFLRCAAVSSAVAVLGLGDPVHACINGSLPSEPRPRKPARVALLGPDEQAIAKLIKAEEAVRLGNYWVAATELDAIRRELELQGRDGLKSRHARVSALVSVRTRGRWPFWVAGSSNNDAERHLVLFGAIQSLRSRLAENPDDPIRMTDLGEALAASYGHESEARRLLEGLADKDLVTSAHGYAALSRLRKRVGNAKGAAEALERCRRLDERGNVCGGTPKRQHAANGA
jgi:hypothetical protein